MTNFVPLNEYTASLDIPGEMMGLGIVLIDRIFLVKDVGQETNEVKHCDLRV
jgi:hypothetical protein